MESVTTMRSLELKIPPVAMGLLLGGSMWLVAHFIPSLRFSIPADRLIAIVLGLVGLFIAIMGVVSFRRAQTTINPMDPTASSSLVAAGIYQLTRNPMYLGILLVLMGWAVYLGHILAFIIAMALIPLMNRLQIMPEERALEANFGSAFTDYKSKVRRWL